MSPVPGTLYVVKRKNPKDGMERVFMYLRCRDYDRQWDWTGIRLSEAHRFLDSVTARTLARSMGGKVVKLKLRAK